MLRVQKEVKNSKEIMIQITEENKIDQGLVKSAQDGLIVSLTLLKFILIKVLILIIAEILLQMRALKPSGVSLKVELLNIIGSTVTHSVTINPKVRKVLQYHLELEEMYLQTLKSS